MMVVSVTALVSLKSIRNIIAPPVVIVTDCKEVSFAFPTRFRSHLVSKNPIYSLSLSFWNRIQSTVHSCEMIFQQRKIAKKSFDLFDSCFFFVGCLIQWFNKYWLLKRIDVKLSQWLSKSLRNKSQWHILTMIHVGMSDSKVCNAQI